MSNTYCHLFLDEVDDVLQIQVFSVADQRSQHQLLCPLDHLINNQSHVTTRYKPLGM